MVFLNVFSFSNPQGHRGLSPPRLDDYDKSACYARIFNREGAVDGNCLCLDTPFLDAIRSYIEHGMLYNFYIINNKFAANAHHILCYF